MLRYVALAPFAAAQPPRLLRRLMARATAAVMLTLLASHAPRTFAEGRPAERIRVMIETDAGGDPDDEQSLVRFLLYVNEWDVEGIIANRPHVRAGENRNEARTGLAVVTRLLAAYEECWPCLRQNDDRYPAPASLRRRLFCGYEDSSEAVAALIHAVDDADPRPLWFCNWGTDRGSAPSTLGRALRQIARERSPESLARFKQKLRVVFGDRFADDANRPPVWPLWLNTWGPRENGHRWYHRFSALTARAAAFDVERDVRSGHGPLGALYPTNTIPAQKEGDTMSFLYLVPTGMNDPERPDWGSWGGRYRRRTDFTNGNAYSATAEDEWNGSTSRDNTVARWASDLQNDFRARLNWCTRTRDACNHAPVVRLDGPDAGTVRRIRCRPGALVALDASGSADPDGDRLAFEWFAYREAGTYAGKYSPDTPRSARTSLRVPNDAAGAELHLVVRVVDDGTPPLARYGRVVIQVE